MCDRCGKVIDVYADTSGLELAPGDRQGFTVTTTQVVFRGTCAECVAHPPSPQSTNQHEETIHA